MAVVAGITSDWFCAFDRSVAALERLETEALDTVLATEFVARSGMSRMSCMSGIAREEDDTADCVAGNGRATGADTPRLTPPFTLPTLFTPGSPALVVKLVFTLKDAGRNASIRKSVILKPAYSSGAKPISLRPCTAI